MKDYTYLKLFLILLCIVGLWRVNLRKEDVVLPKYCEAFGDDFYYLKTETWGDTCATDWEDVKKIRVYRINKDKAYNYCDVPQWWELHKWKIVCEK